MSLAQNLRLETTRFSRTGAATLNYWTHSFKTFHKANYPNWYRTVRTLCTETFLTIPDQRQRGVGTVFLICERASDWEVVRVIVFKTHSVHCAVYCCARDGSLLQADFRNHQMIFGSLVSNQIQQNHAAEYFLSSRLFLSKSRNSLHFMQPEGSSQYTQQLAIFSLLWTSSRPHRFSSSSILILLCNLILGLPSGLLPSGFHTKAL